MNDTPQIMEAWNNRDRKKTDEENVGRIANAFNLTDDEVVKIIIANRVQFGIELREKPEDPIDINDGGGNSFIIQPDGSYDITGLVPAVIQGAARHLAHVVKHYGTVGEEPSRACTALCKAISETYD